MSIINARKLIPFIDLTPLIATYIALYQLQCTYGQESESVEIGFLWGPKHEQFSNASLSALNLKKAF